MNFTNFLRLFSVIFVLQVSCGIFSTFLMVVPFTAYILLPSFYIKLSSGFQTCIFDKYFFYLLLCMVT